VAQLAKEIGVSIRIKCKCSRVFPSIGSFRDLHSLVSFVRPALQFLGDIDCMDVLLDYVLQSREDTSANITSQRHITPLILSEAIRKFFVRKH